MKKEEIEVWTKELLKTFSQNVKRLRDEKGLTQKDLALKAGIAQATLSSYESGDKNPPLANVVLISKALEVSVDELCGLQGNNNNEIQGYSDIAKFFIQLTKTTFPFTVYGGIPNNEETRGYSPEMAVQVFDSVAEFKSSDEELANFFVELSDMKKLYVNETISYQLFNLWAEDKINTLDIHDVVLGFPYKDRQKKMVKNVSKYLDALNDKGEEDATEDKP